jgi:hypothetical protein
MIEAESQTIPAAYDLQSNRGSCLRSARAPASQSPARSLLAACAARPAVLAVCVSAST